jgi:hypothetical protein
MAMIENGFIIIVVARVMEGRVYRHAGLAAIAGRLPFR